MRKSIVWLTAAALLVACEKKQEQEKPAEPEAAPAAPAPAAGEAAEAGEPAKADDPALKLLDAAIEARGGLEKAEAVEGWTASTRGVYMGGPYQAVNHYTPGTMRMDVLDPAGEPAMKMLFSLDDCWSQIGKVLIPCTEQTKDEYRTMMAMDQAFLLYPLKEAGWKLEAGEQEVEGTTYKTLQVEHAGTDAKGTLFFDPESHQLVRMSYQGSMMGKPTSFVTTYTDYKETCGIQLPGASETTADGKPYVTETCTEVTCGAPAPEVFRQPEQVADGTCEIKKTPPMTLACVKHKGPYQNMGKAFEKLTASMQKQGMMPMGPAVMTYLKAPPRVKNPKKLVTEVCFPVAAKAPRRPAKKAGLVIKGVKARDVLAIYGVGDYQEKSSEMARNIMKEAKKRKLRPRGPVCQISYMEPGKLPVEQMVSEMQIPVKAGKGMKGKRVRKGKRAGKGTR